MDVDADRISMGENPMHDLFNGNFTDDLQTYVLKKTGVSTVKDLLEHPELGEYFKNFFPIHDLWK